VVAAIDAATGYGWDLQDMLAVGERATNLARIFNLREGFGPADDTLPARLFTPSAAGALAGVAVAPEELAEALQHLYRLKGWDPANTRPGRARLQALGLAWVADLLDGLAP